MDKIIYHKEPLDVRVDKGRVRVCIARPTHAVVVADFADSPENRDRCIRFVDRHWNNPRTIKALTT